MAKNKKNTWSWKRIDIPLFNGDGTLFQTFPIEARTFGWLSATCNINDVGYVITHVATGYIFSPQFVQQTGDLKNVKRMIELLVKNHVWLDALFIKRFKNHDSLEKKEQASMKIKLIEAVAL